MPFSASAFALMLANAVPLIGVVALGWQVFPLVLLYWLENVVVGGFNVLRMLCARPRDGVRWAAKAFLVPFFIVALKTAVDLRAHLAERSRFGGEATPAPVA